MAVHGLGDWVVVTGRNLCSLQIKIATACIAAIAFCFPVTEASADSEEAIYFGGAAFTGALARAENDLPVIYAAIGETGLSHVNKRLVETFAEKPPTRFQLESADLAKLDGTGTATAMAVAIDRESIIVDQIGDQQKLLFELAVQVLFFDFRERIIRFAYPVTIQRIEVLDAPPTEEQIKVIALDMLFGDSPASLAPAVASALEEMELPRAASRRLQVVEVSWNDSVANQFPGIVRNASTGMVGHEFSKILSAELRLGLLPYQPGHAIGGAMAARFADGRVYNLSMPTPDYEIRLTLEDFRGRTLKESASFRQDLLGAFFRIAIEEPLSGRSYINHSLRYGATKTIPATQSNYDKDSAYYETLILGLVSFAESLSNSRDEKWVREQPEAKAVRTSMASIRELITKCR